ncbi:hypothetical protein J7E68_14760 [Microbacterium sp. ISL-103]|uniref:hypothetical protein n=1 Tax=Microbacterium sp. ISL-103 TaxID=2819156 RepID=UPI001BE5646A|nr:hypothetical protein [Microbacterium sp. ISL-103]MBT2475798.1 hypothetical protein [Microbacterium sp. ISL-103]
MEVLGDTAPHPGEQAREEIPTTTAAVVGKAETLSDDDLDYARAEARSEVDAQDSE